MSEDILTIRSAITSELHKKILFKGSFLSFLGFIPLLYGSLRMDAATLSTWGIPLFFLGISLIMFGMVPYKRVTELQKHPNELHLLDDRTIRYDHMGKKTMTIPLSALERVEYLERDGIYGIKLYLKKSPEKKLIVHDPRFSINRFENASRKKYGCDLFLPYFSKRGFSTAFSNVSGFKHPPAQDRAS